MMIPYGNICAGHISPLVSLRSTHGYNKDHPQGDATHTASIPRTSRGCCHRGRASTRPYIACCTSTKYAGITLTKYTGVAGRGACMAHMRVAVNKTAGPEGSAVVWGQSFVEWIGCGSDGVSAGAFTPSRSRRASMVGSCPRKRL